MAEGKYDIPRVLGGSTSLRGEERTMHKHKFDKNILIGVEAHPKSPEDMRLYYLTAGLFRSMFPENFPKVIAVEQHEDGTQLAVVAKIDATRKFGPEYRRAKAKFLDRISEIFIDSAIPDLGEMFDFKGDQPNLLIKEGNPVYVDKIDPMITEYLDVEKIKKMITDPRKQKAILRLFEKTKNAWLERKTEKQKQYDLLESLV